MEVKFGETHTELTVQHLDYGNIIGARQLNPTCLFKLAEILSHMYTIMQRNITKQAGEDFADVLFVKWQQMEILPGFYKRPIEFLEPMTYLDCLKRKLQVLHYCLPIKKSMQPHCFAAIDNETDAPLFVTSVVSVNVDPTLGRPTPFPLSLRNYFTSDRCQKPTWYKNIGQPKCRKEFSFQPIENKFYTRKCTVGIRHVSRFNYITQSALVEICLECFGEALAKSTFGSTGSIFERQVRRVSMLYLQISNFGDILETSVWQDKCHPLVFKFHVKKGSVVVCQAEIELYPEPVSCKLVSKL